MKILLVAGARPNFMKIAPIIRQLRAKGNESNTDNLSWKLVHTGQHYDYDMSKVFFEDFSIPEPDYFLNVGSWSHAQQTAKIMVAFEKVCLEEKPDIVMVVGDVNSTLSSSITSKKLNIKVAHVEAGLRSGDMTMPEEINRIVTDSISDFLFVTEKSGIDNLMKEGKKEEQLFFVGNTMIDTLLYSLEKLKRMKLPGINGSKYAIVTLHRPSNVDNKEKLKGILTALMEISRDMDIYFPIHPRTEKNINNYGLTNLIEDSNIKTMPPQSYFKFLALWKDASLVLTDSGGLQEETTALGIPCFTIRDNTERPVTIKEGTNKLVGAKREKIMDAYSTFKNSVSKKRRIPEFWDGKAAERIVDVLYKLSKL